jgi:uncharacterized damage-inducible protein DinB
MKPIVQQLAAYNVWANEQLLKFILTLPVDLHTKEVASSFNSLLKTILHMWDAESIWWQRMRLSEKIIRPSENFAGQMEEAVLALLQQSRLWQEWTNAAQEHMITHEFIYLNSKREQFKQPVYQVILQVCNHATYHRGQLVNMLRQLGIEKIPQTDYVVFSRKSK